MNVNDIRRTWPYWRRIAVANIVATVMVMGFRGAFAEPGWRALPLHFGVALVYTTPVSLFLGLGLPSVMPRVARLTPAVAWSARIAAILALAFAGCAVAELIFVAAGAYGPDRYWSQLLATFRVATVIAIVVATSWTVLEGMRTRLEETTLALRTKELDEERARKLATEAQLAALESRVHPHFLFNTLNTIAALIQEDPAEAERTVGRLAALLRFSLDATAAGSTPIQQELTIVRDYLEIESARFGDRLHFDIDLDPQIADAPIPPLSIQTLVENAVKHGLSTRREGGRIRVSAHRNGGAIAIDVADNGEQFSAPPFPAGHGLDNVQGRLRALYGSRATLRLSREGDWTTAAIRLPGGGDAPARPA